MKVVARMARRQLDRQVPDPALRSRLTPDYTIGCKRILISSDYYPALSVPSVELVTDRIARLESDRIVTTDGVQRPVDAIIYGTGFHVTDGLGDVTVTGPDGRTLADAWVGRHGGLPGYHGGRLPQPVPAARPEHRPGPQLGGVHDRGAGPVRADAAWGWSAARPRWPCPRRPRSGSTSGCSADGRVPCGRSAAAAAGTSTSGASTGRCGRVRAPGSGCVPAARAAPT